MIALGLGCKAKISCPIFRKLSCTGPRSSRKSKLTPACPMKYVGCRRLVDVDDVVELLETPFESLMVAEASVGIVQTAMRVGGADIHLTEDECCLLRFSYKNLAMEAGRKCTEELPNGSARTLCIYHTMRTLYISASNSEDPTKPHIESRHTYRTFDHPQGIIHRVPCPRAHPLRLFPALI